MMEKLGLIVFMSSACVGPNPDYILLSFPEDSCVNALAVYEICEWDWSCRRILREDYPGSWEPAKVTYEQCYVESPRCEALEKGCEVL